MIRIIVRPRVIYVMGLFTGLTTVSAQPTSGVQRWVDSAKVLIDAGMNSSSPQGLDPAIALLDRVLTVVPNDGVLLHYKGYALYRKSTLMQNGGSEDDLKTVLEEASQALEESAKTLQWAETFALHSSIFGQMISLSPGPFNAMRLGPKSDHAMAHAVALGPNNPRVFLLRGVGSIFKPALFGGGLDKAEKDIQKAIALFASDKPEAPAPSWGYAEAYAWLGRVYLKQDRPEEARAAYNRALELQPDYGWVKFVLLPELENKKR
jgi:tetratricopeptide (TPR) repeat protein